VNAARLPARPGPQREWPFHDGPCARALHAPECTARLGPPALWPPVLRQAVTACLDQGFAAFVWWGDDLIQFYNDAAIPVLDTKHPAALGAPAREVWSDVWDEVGPLIDDVLRTGRAIAREDLLVHPSRGGETRPAWFTASYAPLRDESGTVCGLTIVCFETTTQGVTREQLRRTEERLHLALATGRMATWDWDPAVDRIIASPSLHALFGLAADQAFATSAHGYALVHPDDRGAHRARVESAMRSGGPWHSEFRIVRPCDGEIAWLEERAVVTHDDATGRSGMAGVIWDITERKVREAAQRAEHARRDLLLRLDERLRAQGACTADEIPQVAVSMLGPFIGAIRAGYAVDAGDGETLVVSCVYANGVAGGEDLHGGPGLGAAHLQALRDGRPVVHEDIAQDPGLSPQARARLARLQAGASLDVPLLRAGRLVAVLFVHHAAPRRWTDDERELVSAVAARTWAAVERAAAEAAAREREARLLLFADVVPDLLWTSDAQGRVDWCNERLLAYFGETYAVGDDWSTRVHPDDLEAARAGWRRAIEAGEAASTEHRLRGRSPEYRWHLVRAAPLRDAEGRIVQWIGAMTDIHEARAARELLEARVKSRTRELEHAAELLRQLNVRLEQVQDDERRRIARELHDALGQQVTAVMLAVSHAASAEDPGAVRHGLSRVSALMRELDMDLDRLVFQLRPTGLEDGGLADGVAAHAATWSELTGVRVDLLTRGLEGRRLPLPVEAAVFRVVQEALNNVARHAQARLVGLTLEVARGVLRATIEDDGRGFVVDAEGAPTSWGLLGMTERIEALGGRVAIESAPGAGTTVLVQVPIVG
jgi:PAS domain S-box-containing protein